MQNKAALIVIDFINDIVHPDGKIAKNGNAKFIAEHRVIQYANQAMTIDHTARDAHDRYYSVIVLKDACGAADQAHHEAALLVIGRISKIITNKDLQKELS